MSPLHDAHLVLLSLWGGFVLAEGVVELAARDDASRRAAARLHYWMDVLVELPLLAGVLATGGLLAARSWPLTRLHWIKVAAGLAAVAMNLFCVAHVVARQRRAGDPAALRRHGRFVKLAAGLGLPFALVAATLGFAYFRR